MLPFEIRAIVPSCFNDYAVRRDFPLTAFSTCTPLCRRAKICLYLRHRAFRSEQSRHIPDPLPDGSQGTGGAFRSRVQRPGVRHRSIGAGQVSQHHQDGPIRYPLFPR